MDIPFKNYDTEIKPILSGIDIALDLSNIRSAIEISADKVIEVISQEVWDLAIDHYNSDNFESEEPTFEVLDGLVYAIQKALAPLAFYNHFPYLSVRISNDSITRREANNEKSAYKYQVDEIKENLIKTAWNYMDSLIKYLNDNATKYTLWTANTAYSINDIVYIESTEQYYQCIIAHTSSDSFDSDISNWANVDKEIGITNYTAWVAETAYTIGEVIINEESELIYVCNADHTSSLVFDDDISNWTLLTCANGITLWQWIESDEYITTKETLFDDYKQFNKILNIGNSSYVFSLLVPIINEIIFTTIEPVLELTTIRSQLKYNTVSTTNQDILNRIRRFLAYKSLAEAMIMFDYSVIPEPYRKMLNNEFDKQNKDKAELNSREKLSALLRNKADMFYNDFENYLDTQKEISQQTQTENYTFTDYPNIILNANDKFLATI